jgi:beta-mannosidase
MNLLKYLFLAGIILMNASCDIIEKGVSRIEMEIKSDWKFKQDGKDEWLPASVPGCVHTDLINNGKIEDPFYRDNERSLQWIEKENWIYKTSFNINDDILGKEKIEMVFEGLDTYAEVFLNDTLILKADNMFRTWTIDVSSTIKTQNSILIKFTNVFDESIHKFESTPYPRKAFYNNDQAEIKVGLYNRKAQFHFGWDWGPRFVTAGIWRKIKIAAYDHYKLDGVQIIQNNVIEKQADLTAVFEILSEKEQLLDLKIKVEEADIEKETVKKVVKGFNKIEIPFSIENPQLWWTNGLGEPYLYEIVLEAENESGNLERKLVRTGIRSLEIMNDADQYGKSLYVKLNGVPVFIKGTNYIPQDNFQSRVTADKYEFLIKSSVEANMNMLRVWGGGIYEEDIFYDLCDQNGILVWQDFIFACAMYPGDEDFLNSVRHEVIDNVRRIRNHASLALYCGNNENEVGWHEWGWQENLTERQKEQYLQDYKNLFHKTIPNAISEYDTTRYYHPSSPNAGFGGRSLSEGDAHYWGVWHGKDPFERFEDNVARFMSEYGFQSYPELNAVEKFTLPEDRYATSEVMKSHQRCMKDEGGDKEYGNRLIETYMGMYFKKPKDFESYLYLSQILQAYGIEMALNIHRRNMPYCMGTLYWQLNDCWPVASWSSIDYYGNWKALHYKAKQAFEEIVVLPKLNGDSLEVYIVSDKREKFDAELKAESMDFHGNLLDNASYQLSIEELTSKKYAEMAIEDILKGKSKQEALIKFAVIRNGDILAEKIFYLVSPKDLKLLRSEIAADIEGNKVSLISDVLAKDVFLSFPGISGKIFSDNYFDLLPGQEKTITIETEDHINKNDLRIISLVNSFNDQ